MSYNFHCIHEMYILLLPERLVVVYLFALHCVAFNWYEFVLVTEFIAFQLEKKNTRSRFMPHTKNNSEMFLGFGFCCVDSVGFVVLTLSVLSNV